MASSSRSFVQRIFKYDVFISFRGEDTRKTFVDHLYYALKDRGILSYKDDKMIRQGRKISDELMNSIENSKLYIIVFSKNYASSSWCLDELVKIMECQNAKDQIAYPVFYDVEPTQVRKQIGAVGEGFAKHVNAESAGKWRWALKEAADLAGLELKTTANGHEAEFIKQIVEKISLELPCSSPDENLIGMKSRVEDVVSSLEIGIDDVRVIGIKGMGGGGKTTLARAVFDYISHTFEGQSFVADVRVVSKASGLNSVQEQILSDLSKDGSVTVNDVYDGKHKMKRMVRNRRVLVVLDDVDHVDQLEGLAIDSKWFNPGSRIIVTTRDEKVLKVRGVKVITLDVNLLSNEEAISLFSRYAFGSENIIQGYENLSEQVVRYAAGLPLTIKVLGSFLFGEDKPEWEDVLKRLETIPLKETLEKLEISYIGLEDDYKEIFLDVACFHKGCYKDEAIKALESQGFNARIGLRVLEQKSLITISYGNRLNMHDHIEEMGKNIVRRSDPDEPWRHRRLWIEAEIKDILANDQGTEATRGLHFEPEEFEYEILMNGLQNMKKLRFLYLNIYYLYDSKIGKCCPNLPNSLQYLQWLNSPFECLPITFTALNHLRFLKIQWSKLVTFDFELIPNLETLILFKCNNMVKFHIPKGCPKLKYLDLRGSSALRILNLGPTPGLETLMFNECLDLVEFRIHFLCLKLKSIIPKSSKSRFLDLGCTIDLEMLDLKACDSFELHLTDGCPNLKRLNLSLSKLRNLTLGPAPNLESLDLDGCCDLVELHLPEEYPNLKHLNLKGLSKLRNLILGPAPNLETLSLDGCCDLEQLHMRHRYPKLKSIILTASKLKTLDLGLISHLETLCLEKCGLVEFQMPEECPNLKDLNLRHVSKLRNLTLGLAPNLESINLAECFGLVEFHIPFGCPNLQSLSLNASRLRTLGVGDLILDIERLGFIKCFDLVDIHNLVKCLKRLVYFDLNARGSYESYSFDKRFQSIEIDSFDSLSGVYLVTESIDICPFHLDNNSCKFHFIRIYEEHPFPVYENHENLMCISQCAGNVESFTLSVCHLRFIKKLTLEGNIPEAPKDLDQLRCLEELIFSTKKIKNLPDSLCMLKQLKTLRFESCWLLEKLPEDIGVLECLEKLVLTDCIFLRGIPNSICKMGRLKNLHVTHCFLVEKLPEEIGVLESLKELNIHGSGINRLPPSIFQLKGLRIVGTKWRLQSYGFTSLMQTDMFETCCFI